MWALDLDPLTPSCATASTDCQSPTAAMALAVANAKNFAAKITLTVGTGAKAVFDVPAQSTILINVPPKGWSVSDPGPLLAGFSNLQIKLQFDQILSVVQLNPAPKGSDATAAATALLPGGALGDSYVVAARPHEPSAASPPSLSIVSTSDGTTVVKIVPTAPLNGGDVTLATGQSTTFKLGAGVLHLTSTATDTDLTGTQITADKAFAVFFGASVAIPGPEPCSAGTRSQSGWACTTSADCPKVCCPDHIEAQLWPEQAWAKAYVAAHFVKRGKAKDLWRVVAGAMPTTVTTQPAQGPPMVLAAYQWAEFGSDQDFVISGTKVFGLVQFMAGSHAPAANNGTCTGSKLGKTVCESPNSGQQTPIGCAKNTDCPNVLQPDDAQLGDPEMVWVPNPALWPWATMVVCPDGFAAHYVTLVVQGSPQVKLDGKVLPVSAFVPVAQGYAVARIALSAGAHQVMATGPVGLTVHGWSQGKSYAYAPLGSK